MARQKKTQQDLAELLGFTRQAVSRRLTGQVPFSIDELSAIADYLGIPLTVLVAEAVAS